MATFFVCMLPYMLYLVKLLLGYPLSYNLSIVGLHLAHNLLGLEMDKGREGIHLAISRRVFIHRHIALPYRQVSGLGDFVQCVTIQLLTGSTPCGGKIHDPTVVAVAAPFKTVGRQDAALAVRLIPQFFKNFLGR